MKEAICKYLVENGFAAVLDENCLTVEKNVDQYLVEIFHVFPKEIGTSFPAFYLKDRENYPYLAHVSPNGGGIDVAFVCTGDIGSFSLNFDQPELVYLEAVARTLGLIEKALTDDEWNQSEIRREYTANWAYAVQGQEKQFFYFTGDDAQICEIKVKKPTPKRRYGIEDCYVGFPETGVDVVSSSYLYKSISKIERKREGKGCVITLDLLPLPPTGADAVEGWWEQVVSSFTENQMEELSALTSKWNERIYHIVFRCITPSGEAWVGLKCTSREKRRFPISKEKCNGWRLYALNINPVNKKRLLPRSGADISLQSKSVAVVGCGSVGSVICDNILKAGIGSLLLIDPDRFKIDNLFRHTLGMDEIGAYKANALYLSYWMKYGYCEVSPQVSRLSYLKDNPDILRGLDLVIVAIGSPTEERMLNRFLMENDIKTPVIYTWVEGYGVGGHAVFVSPDFNGCLECTYISPDQQSKALSSNLNFMAENQDFTVNHAGCGDLYLPYTGLDSSQTAMLASRLAIQSLSGQLTDSMKVSWKGEEQRAHDEGFELTHRFYHFSKNLIPILLHSEKCDVCNG